MNILLIDIEPARRKKVEESIEGKGIFLEKYEQATYGHILRYAKGDISSQHEWTVMDLNLCIIHLGNGIDFGNPRSMELVSQILKNNKNLIVIGYTGDSESIVGTKWLKLIEADSLRDYKDRIGYFFEVNSGTELNWKNFINLRMARGLDESPSFEWLSTWPNEQAVEALRNIRL